MPAPGNDSVPTGRSPLSASTSEPERDEDAAGDVIGADDHDLSVPLAHRASAR